MSFNEHDKQAVRLVFNPHELPRRTLFRHAAGLGAVVFLAACGQDDPSPSGAKSITVKDQRGKTLTFSHPVRRIVTMPNPAASILIAVDQSTEHIVGMNNDSWTAIRDGILGELFPQALEIPHDVAAQDFAPNVETLLQLKPDLVVQWSDHGSAVVAPMENVGLDVLGVVFGLQEDVYTWFRLFAGVLDKPERAQQMIDRSDAQLREMKTLAARASAMPPKILYFNRFDGGFKVANAGVYNDFYIKLVGGVNAVTGLEGKEKFVGVDIEQVLSWDPDIVLLGNFDAAVPDDVYGNKIWKDVSAVRSRRVYKVPLGGYRWDPPSHESPLMWRWLSKVAFPEVESPSLRDHIVSDYKFFYDATVTDAQMDKILWMDLNTKSANYEQFDAS